MPEYKTKARLHLGKLEADSLVEQKCEGRGEEVRGTPVSEPLGLLAAMQILDEALSAHVTYVAFTQPSGPLTLDPYRSLLKGHSG